MTACLSELNLSEVKELISGERIHCLKWSVVSIPCILKYDHIEISDSHILKILRVFIRVAMSWRKVVIQNFSYIVHIPTQVNP